MVVFLTGDLGIANFSTHEALIFSIFSNFILCLFVQLVRCNFRVSYVKARDCGRERCDNSSSLSYKICGEKKTTLEPPKMTMFQYFL